MSDFLNALFGIALAAWSFTLHSVTKAVDKLSEKFDELLNKFERLSNRVTVIEVKQGVDTHDV